MIDAGPPSTLTIMNATSDALAEIDPPPPEVLVFTDAAAGKVGELIREEANPNLKLRVYTTGMRQNRLARLVGIDEAYLSRIINGVRVPGKQMQEQIAQVLGCDANWLFEQTTVQVAALDSQRDMRDNPKVG